MTGTIGVVTASIAGTLLSVGIFWAGVVIGQKIRREYLELKATAKGMVSTNAALLQVANKVALELSMLRSIFTANQGGTPDPGDQSQYQSAPRTPAVGFPSVPSEMFGRGPEPEAKEEDTDIVNTSDAEFKEIEEIEAVRARGFDTE